MREVIYVIYTEMGIPLAEEFVNKNVALDRAKDLTQDYGERHTVYQRVVTYDDTEIATFSPDNF